MTRGDESDALHKQLVEAIYAAALNPDAWREVLAGLAEAIEGEIPVLFGHDSARQASTLRVSIGLDERERRDYQEYYGARNIWLQRGRHLLVSGTVRTSRMMCSDAELRRSEFYNDYLRPLRRTHGIGATIWREKAYSYNLTVMRPADAQPFGTGEVRAVEALMPHLRRAIQIRRHLAQLELRERANAAVIDALPAGVLLVDARQRVVFRNAAALGILDSADGLRLVNGTLVAEVPGERTRLRQLILHAADRRASGDPSGGGAISIARRSSGTPLAVLVTSLPVGSDLLADDPPVAAVFVFDEETSGDRSEAILVRLYGLSRAESRVVGRLLRGETVETAADHLGIRVQTARTHLKRALAKTGTNRQAALIRRLLSGPAALRTIPVE